MRWSQYFYFGVVVLTSGVAMQWPSAVYQQRLEQQGKLTLLQNQLSEEDGESARRAVLFRDILALRKALQRPMWQEILLAPIERQKWQVPRYYAFYITWESGAIALLGGMLASLCLSFVTSFCNTILQGVRGIFSRKE